MLCKTCDKNTNSVIWIFIFFFLFHWFCFVGTPVCRSFFIIKWIFFFVFGVWGMWNGLKFGAFCSFLGAHLHSFVFSSHLCGRWSWGSSSSSFHLASSWSRRCFCNFAELIRCCFYHDITHERAMSLLPFDVTHCLLLFRVCSLFFLSLHVCFIMSWIPWFSGNTFDKWLFCVWFYQSLW